MRRAICVLCLLVTGSAQPVQAQSQPGLIVVGPTAGQDFITFVPSVPLTPGWFTDFDAAIAKMRRELLAARPFGLGPFVGYDSDNQPALPPRTQEIKAILDAAGTTGGAEAKAGIAELLATSPGQAEAYTATLIEISASGIPPYYPANDSLTSILAEALATQVAAWQAQAARGFPAATAALAAVNAAFAAAGLLPGSAFAVAFAAKLNELGGQLLPPTLAPPDSPLAVVVPFIQKNPTSLISAN